jgi:hypothetical protein
MPGSIGINPGKIPQKSLMKKTALIPVALLIGLMVWSSHGADISGEWRAEFDTQIGTQKYVFTFQAETNKLTGKSELRGQWPETRRRTERRQN